MESDNSSSSKMIGILIAFFLVAALSLGFYVYQGKPVSLSVDGTTTKITSRSKTVEELIEEEEVKFEKGAYINVPLDTELEKDLNIMIINPKPYTVKVRDTYLEVRSIYDTADQILKEQGLKLGQQDYTEPGLKERLSPGSTIEVFRVNEELVVEESTIPFDEEVKTTDKLDRGTKRIAQKGQEGLKRTYIRKKYINGQLVSTAVEKEEIAKEPVTQIVEKGTRERVVPTSRGNTRYRKAITMQATGYDLSYQSTGKSPGDKYYGITASGMRARVGVVAIDPRVIPYGTKLYIKSLDGTKDYGFAIAGDTGGAIKGNRIDLFFNSRREALRFGRRNVKVYILE